VYEHARKVDTIKVQERIKATVKKNGKSRTVTKAVTKLVDEDFTWEGSARRWKSWHVGDAIRDRRDGSRFQIETSFGVRSELMSRFTLDIAAAGGDHARLTVGTNERIRR
jgi:hypothetical protein